MAPQDAAVNNAIRKLGLFFALGVIFLRYSLLHEVLAYYSGTNTRVLYLFLVPALLCLFASGGIQRVFSARPALYWLGFVCWLFITVPFSTWVGDSATYALIYLRVDMPMMLFLGGLAITWKECKLLLYTIGFGACFSALSAALFGAKVAGRTALQFGTIANPNDYACVLILGLPFILFMVVRPMDVFPPLRVLIRIAAVGLALYATYVMMECGSRGALLAVVLCVAFAFIKSRMATRMSLLLAVPAALIVAQVVLPEHTLARLQMFSTEIHSWDDEAGESAYMRKKYLLASINDTFSHPIFGIGPNQFPNFEGKSKNVGQGGWSSCHNSYTQVSSEMGFPGLLLYLAGLFSTFLLLMRTWKQAAKHIETKEIATACFCISISFIGYCATIFFINFGYYFYLPAFAGLVIVVSAALKRELNLLSAAGPAAVQPQPAFKVFTGRRPTPAWAVEQPRLAPSPNRYRFNGER